MFNLFRRVIAHGAISRNSSALKKWFQPMLSNMLDRAFMWTENILGGKSCFAVHHSI